MADFRSLVAHLRNVRGELTPRALGERDRMKLFNIDDVTKLNARFIMAHTDTIRASLRGPDLETHR